MTHLDDIIRQVDEALTRHVIFEMNTLLITLSNDTQLSRQDRYLQQQRLRTAIAQKGNGQHRSDTEAQNSRREQLIKGGQII